MRSLSLSKNYASGLVLLALLAGCSAAQVTPPQAGGASSLHSSLHRLALHAAGEELVLYPFTGGPSDGFGPYDTPIADSKGALYGTTMTTDAGGAGVVWKLTPSGKSYKESALYKFPTNRAQGADPIAGLIADSSGNLYGTASAGGKGKCTFSGTGCGVVFKLTPKGSGYTESMLHDFDVSTKNDGTIPTAALLLVGSELYGTTMTGGGTCTQSSTGCGTVFELSTKGSGYKVLYNFQGGTDGAFPETGLIAGKSGVLYGTTNNGGDKAVCPNGCGTVFTLTPKGAGYTESIAYSFKGGSSDGEVPGYRGRGLYAGASGTLLGTTELGGSGGCGIGFLGGCGIVFELTPSGSSYTETVLYDFQGGKDGAFPYEDLVASKSGVLYGATAGGETGCGSLGCGTVFALTPSKTGYTESVVHGFTGGSDGANPYGGVMINKAGELFGTTYYGGGGSSCTLGCGTVFEAKP